jgi:hypothetical protein
MGPQRDPNIQIPCFQVCRFQDTPLQIPDSEFPSFQGLSVGPRKDHAFQIPRLLLHSMCTDSWILSANSRFQDSECADSRILSANSRFRVSEFPRPPLGSGLEVHPNSRFRVIPSFRGAPHFAWVLAQGTPKFQIPSFRVSEAPSSVQGRWNPKFQIPSFRVSEDPSSWLLGRRTQQEGPTNSQKPDQSFRV